MVGAARSRRRFPRRPWPSSSAAAAACRRTIPPGARCTIVPCPASVASRSGRAFFRSRCLPRRRRGSRPLVACRVGARDGRFVRRRLVRRASGDPPRRACAGGARRRRDAALAGIAPPLPLWQLARAGGGGVRHRLVRQSLQFHGRQRRARGADGGLRLFAPTAWPRSSPATVRTCSSRSPRRRSCSSPSTGRPPRRSWAMAVRSGLGFLAAAFGCAGCARGSLAGVVSACSCSCPSSPTPRRRWGGASRAAIIFSKRTERIIIKGCTGWGRDTAERLRSTAF